MNENTETVMITGAAGNLGQATARAFADRGAKLALLDRDAIALRDAYGADDDRQLSFAVDLLDEHAVATALECVAERFGRVSVLCNLAGGFRMGELVHETGQQTWDTLLDLNARSILIVSRSVVPHMLSFGGGFIVNVGAAAAARGAAGMGAYTAAKSAVARLTEAMSAELRTKGIHVNCVLPSIIDTPQNRQAMPGVDPSRWVDPADLAAVIAFLASPGARAVHGASVPVIGLS